MKRLIKFVRQYLVFCTALVTLIVAIILQLTKQTTAAHLLLGIVSIALILPFVKDMWLDFRSGSYGLDLLAVSAIVASVALGQYYAAIVVVLMLSGGQSLENYAEHKARSELDNLLAHAPRTAHVIRKGKTLKINISELKVGDKIIIKAGEITPVDATVIESSANFDESSITGESLPQLKEEGSLLLSGSVSLDGAVKAKVLHTAEDSQYQQIIKLVKMASASKAPFVRLAERYSLPFSILAFALGIFAWVISGHSIRFLEVIIVATPCPLLLAAPIALISGMTRASRYGVLVKTGSSLEQLADTTVVAFDKTGTLTKGELSVTSIVSFNKIKENEILRFAASLEQNSNHVLARAITGDASLKQIKLIKVKHLEEIAGRGLKANIKGDEIIVGNYKLLEDKDIKLPEAHKLSKLDETVAYVAINGQLEGLIAFVDEIRPETKATLSQLHKLGIKDIMMITGDNENVSNKIAKQLGIDTVHANSLPSDKLKILSSVTDRPVVFVGDGVNDAPVLTYADVGIALGAKGSPAAAESADMVVMQDDLSKVAVGIEIAIKTFAIAKQSILIGIGISIILMAIFSTGKFPPLLGAILQEVVDVIVIFNALRAHMIKPSVVYED